MNSMSVSEVDLREKYTAEEGLSHGKRRGGGEAGGSSRHTGGDYFQGAMPF